MDNELTAGVLVAAALTGFIVWGVGIALMLFRAWDWLTDADLADEE